MTVRSRGSRRFRSRTRRRQRNVASVVGALFLLISALAIAQVDGGSSRRNNEHNGRDSLATDPTAGTERAGPSTTFAAFDGESAPRSSAGSVGADIGSGFSPGSSAPNSSTIGPTSEVAAPNSLGSGSPIDPSGSPTANLPVSTPGSQQSLPTGPTTTVDFPVFQCSVAVNSFLGGRTGDVRRVEISMTISRSEIGMVWYEVLWDDMSKRGVVTVNPAGSMKFVVAAPGNEWPVARVYASPTYRAQTSMCAS